MGGHVPRRPQGGVSPVQGVHEGDARFAEAEGTVCQTNGSLQEIRYRTERQQRKMNILQLKLCLAALLGVGTAVVSLFSCSNSAVDKGMSVPESHSVVEVELSPPDPKLVELLRGFSYLSEEDDTCYDFVGRVINPDGGLIGTCVLIDPNVAITASHCVIEGKMDNTKIPRVQFGLGVYEVERIEICPLLKERDTRGFLGMTIVGDLAVLKLTKKVPTETLPVMANGVNCVRTYEEVKLVGFGHGVKKETVGDSLYTSGITVDYPEDIPMYGCFARPWFGDSGGPIFNSNGELVGILYRFSSMGEDPEGVAVEYVANNLGYYEGWIRIMRRSLGEPLP